MHKLWTMSMHQFFLYVVTLIWWSAYVLCSNMFLSSLFVLVMFVDLNLHVLFLSVLKISKTHKN